MAERKSLALFKAPSEKKTEDPYVTALNEINISATCIPVLGFTFINLGKVSECLKQPDKYSGLIFTSPRAVESVMKAIEMMDKAIWLEICAKWQDKNTFVVGEATGKAARELGFKSLGNNTGSAENLIPLIVEETSPNCPPLLFPCGNLRRETIPSQMREHNIALEPIITYHTSANPDIRQNFKQSYPNTAPNFLVFFSPSVVNFTMPVLQEMSIDMHGIKCVAIGPTTSEALEKALGKAPAAVASKPTPAQLTTAVLSTAL